MSIRYDDKVAIVTGSGGGLGRCHAIELAKRGAKVVVNDLGGSVDGSGAGSEAAQAVVAEIEAAGGEAIANGANVAKYDEVEAMVKQAMDKWGRVDILVNNAGILRDKSFPQGQPGGLQAGPRRAPDGFRQLHQGLLGNHARPGLRPRRRDDLLLRPLRQLRPGQLRQRQDGRHRHDEHAGPGGIQVRHQDQCVGADGRHPHDRGPAAGRGLRHADTRRRSPPRCCTW